MTYFQTRFGRVLSAFLLLGLAACASPATSSNMTVVPTGLASPVSPQLENAIAIESISGGEATNPLWTSEVGQPEFRVALEDSLRNAGLLSTANTPAKYKLKATLTAVEQPLFGFDLTVKSAVVYLLYSVADRSTWYDRQIIASYTATVSDSFVAIKRLQLANEGSIRKNIATFIDEINALANSNN